MSVRYPNLHRPRSARREVALGCVWLVLAMAVGGFLALHVGARVELAQRDAALGRCAGIAGAERACCLAEVRRHFGP